MAFDSAAAGANGVIGAALCLAGVDGIAGVDADVFLHFLLLEGLRSAQLLVSLDLLAFE